ncbi:hypothetical protein E2C01_031645 [Portunus trituberculatus]|uniref:Uncharacterized protein n=1 Tax=Portunus trituberculatus TaxID=210409 RepID=A0A5B7ETA7_PORTR|nr:hypothetical protein [Portunus trituberculatus]
MPNLYSRWGVVSKENCTLAPPQPTQGRRPISFHHAHFPVHRLAAGNKTGCTRRRVVTRLREGEAPGGGSARRQGLRVPLVGQA